MQQPICYIFILGGPLAAFSCDRNAGCRLHTHLAASSFPERVTRGKQEQHWKTSYSSSSHQKTHSDCVARDSTGPASEQTTAVAAHPVDATAAAAVLHQKASAAACLLVPHALRQVAQGSGYLSVCIITMFVLCAAAGLHAGPAVQPELCVWQ